MLKFEAYKYAEGDVTTVYWGNSFVCEYLIKNGKYYVMPITPNFTSSEVYLDNEIEVLEYIIELIRVLENE